MKSVKVENSGVFLFAPGRLNAHLLPLATPRCLMDPTLVSYLLGLGGSYGVSDAKIPVVVLCDQSGAIK